MARLKTTHAQSCAYCYQDFIPRKRGTQRFCSASCRTTHCRKKNAGTLGRVTRLPGPEHRAQGKAQAQGSFAGAVLASATGALAANAVSQTTEYFAVTQKLEKKIDDLTNLVEQLTKNHTKTTVMLVRGTLKALVTLGIPKDVACKLMDIPSSPPQIEQDSPKSAPPQKSTQPEMSKSS